MIRSLLRLDAVRLGALLLALCLFALSWLQSLPAFAGSLPDLKFVAAFVIILLSASLASKQQIPLRVMQDEEYGRPVAPGTGPDSKRKRLS